MDTAIDHDAFYMCTELAPRCYVVQKSLKLDHSQLERMMQDVYRDQDRPPPPAPSLPYWFDQECRQELLLNQLPEPCASNGVPIPSPVPSPVPPPVDLRAQLKAQLEYYFSRENLMTDRYLRCQMDADNFVPISIIAGFRRIVQLTNDYNLILQVLRESPMVEVDELNGKVRPVLRRCTIIIREVAEEFAEEVEKIVSGGPAYVSLSYGLNSSWYITYANEETTQRAYLHLQSSGATINGKPICARIKTGVPPSAEIQERSPSSVPPTASTPSEGPSTSAPPPDPTQYHHLFELGSVLAAYGYVPKATFKPGGTYVHVEEDPAPFFGPSASRGGRGRGRHSPRGGRHNNNNTTYQTTFYNSSQQGNGLSPGYMFGGETRRGTKDYVPRGRGRGRGGGYGGGREYRGGGGRRRTDTMSSTHSNTNYSGTSSYGYADYSRPQPVSSRGGFEPPSFVPRQTSSYYAMDPRQNGLSNERAYKPETLERPEVLLTTERGVERLDSIQTNGQYQESAENNLNRWNRFERRERNAPERNDTQETLSYERQERQERPEREKMDRGRKYEGYVTQQENQPAYPAYSDGRRVRKWERTDEQRPAQGERKNSESSRSVTSAVSAPSGVSGVSAPSGISRSSAPSGTGAAHSSSTSPVSCYSFEERAFPVLVEKKPEPPKPEQKPTFSFVAAGRKATKPEPPRSYAQTLKSSAIH